MEDESCDTGFIGRIISDFPFRVNAQFQIILPRAANLNGCESGIALHQGGQ